MKKLTFVTCMISCFLSISSFAGKQTLDQIVVVVNDDVITRSELSSALAAAKIQIAQEQVPSPPEKLLQKQVLDQLINKKLQLQIAKQMGISVTDKEVNKSIALVAEQNKISVADLYDRLGQEGLSKTAYRSEMKDQIMMHRLQQQEVVGRINVSPEEINSFMRSTAWKNNSNKEYHLEDLLVPVSDSPSTTELNAAKARAVAIAHQLKSGSDFQKVVASGNHQGGDLGWRKLPEIPTAFADSIARMKEKGIAGPIQTSNGFHIIHLTAVRDSNMSTDEMTHSRKQVEQILMQRKFEEAMQHWVSKIRGQSFIETKSLA